MRIARCCFDVFFKNEALILLLFLLANYGLLLFFLIFKLGLENKDFPWYD